MSTSTAGDDPRDPTAEVPLTFPETWQTDSVDSFNATIMFATGLIMVTRNRFLAWPAVILSFNSMINQHPLRTKEGGASPITSLLVAFSALLTCYLPMVLIGPGKRETQTPLPVT
ncbi:uncharacterized protein LAESUDRAFT_80377 [Laetiporus sulphureus 93-53]|uniref:Uncharacterized protein n=1 Tax=Laetiporus sulphureus 93-53 TaxID=1314785 RepID=A0A165F1S9_9APHY|nr:uncharacterized protein LAESUDRAFT_80377 [Laetiporus sulphureus 93-53]KZT08192.1 hypothetical protein LAESUDRAFT_80377 [Laetiporus sulphureus 93-53]